MNRSGRRKRVGPIFELFQSPVATYSIWLDPDVPGEPAYHTYSSVLWQVVCGTGWVVYEQKYSKNWSLAYLWPGVNWGALVDQPYFFLPATRMRLEKTCFVEQIHLPQELIYEGDFPMNVNMHLRGEITAIGKKWIDLTNRHTTSRIPLTGEERESIGNIYIGAMHQIFDEIELDEFFASLRHARKFDPRIIYPYRETAGNRFLFQDEWTWETEAVIDSRATSVE